MAEPTGKPLKIFLVAVGGFVVHYSYHHFARLHDPAGRAGDANTAPRLEKPFMTEAFCAYPQSYASLADKFIQEADGVLLVYNAAGRSIRPQVMSQFVMMERARNMAKSQPSAIVRGRRVAPLPILMAEARASPDAARTVTRQEMADLAAELGIGFVQLATVDESPVEELFYHMMWCMKSYQRQVRLATDYLDLATPMPWLRPTAQPRGSFGYTAKLAIRSLLSSVLPCRRVAPIDTDPLCKAIIADDRETVMHLLWIGADVETPDRYGCTPLHLAVARNRVEIVKMLLDRGAFTDEACPLNGTALSMAAARGSDDMVKMLVDAGASVDVPCDYYGRMLQEIARRDHPCIVQYIEDWEAGRLGRDLSRRGSINVPGGRR